MHNKKDSWQCPCPPQSRQRHIAHPALHGGEECRGADRTTQPCYVSNLTFPCLVSVSMHYGLTGRWVQKFKASYLTYFLQCALADYARGKA